MKILAVECDPAVRDLYHRYLTRRGHQVTEIDKLYAEYSAHDYDVVIVDSEFTKYYILGVPYKNLIVATERPTARPNGAWAISKPFHMEELAEILEVIEGLPCNVTTNKKELQ